MRDLLIAGGGPIGLATALYAVRAGLEVTVREPRAGVIDKACGEGLMPGAVAALRDLGVELGGSPITGIRYVDRHRHVDAGFTSGTGLGVRRTELHAALRERVQSAGVRVVESPVTEIEDRGDHVRVDGEDVRHVVAADGLHSAVRRLVGLEVARTSPRRYGQRVHVRCAPWTSLVEVHWGSAGEAYLTPVGPDEIGVAVLSARRRPFEELLEDFPLVRERIAGHSRSSVRGAGPLRQRSRRRVQGRVLLVGDAAGYVDALTGEGLAVGMAQARAAVDAVASGDPAAYEKSWSRIRRRHDALTLGLVTATRVPVVRRALVPAARAVPTVFRAAVNQLARPA
ncbi:NAD(P)/FAD-dependent oxidoreductase [Knoellia sp. Soil729]|uniref:NAD(P)/FAD-dependent oxidoreductase n=1 Tax=Knoellia sp. Soil729 TaxID=1736394 RepID=UPI0006F2D902|nr:NAD(P)/FAD-dependent oxidoreductase [Knoellia sp. Soil729]KRE42611.1 monooxygenase [Knoellia sp. Soil729]